MLVYRHGSRIRCTTALLRAIDQAHADPLECLLRAGELECGLADVFGATDPRARAASALTDVHAARLMGLSAPHPARLAAANLPQQLCVREPEGYAFYALDPRSYAGCLEAGVLRKARALALVGIRSIGTSLSAVVAAAASRHTHVERTTVRPVGHPWARQLALSEGDRAFVERGRARGARFVIVDEGPGLSGSTFLAVAQALEGAGVACSDIVLLGSHCPNLDRLRATDAASRFRRYQLLCPAARTLGEGRDLSAGRWRELAIGVERRAWPACWVQLERAKLLSPDGRWLDKFEGYAPYCRPALERARLLATAGFAPSAACLGDGLVRYPWLRGRRPVASELDAAWLERLAEYCAFRLQACGSTGADTSALTHMLQVNVAEELGIELDERCALELHAPVVPDARMQPHEWIACLDGGRYKLDGHADGDAHLLPGPCDVAWDVAGAIVEWQMDHAHAEALVRSYEQRSGDRVRARLSNYLLAYCALRVGACAFAEWSADAEEAARLRGARASYRARLEVSLADRGFSRSS